MVTQRKPVRAKPVAPIYQLEIVLDYSKPRIWRLIQVPGNANLGWLHIFTSAFLPLLKWPAVTESQLAKVLMARDGYRG